MRNRNQVVIPLDLGIRIDEKDPVRKLIEICDELDYTDLYAVYLRHWRKIDPRTMFEILVFAYMNGIYSSRDIESACRHDIRFMWILQNEPVPDHSTIARFQNERLTGVMEDLFYQLTEKLYQMGERQSSRVVSTNRSYRRATSGTSSAMRTSSFSSCFATAFAHTKVYRLALASILVPSTNIFL